MKPLPTDAVEARRQPRYYVLRVHNIAAGGDPGLVSVTSGPFIGFENAWYSAGAIRRCYPDQIFIAGELCSTA